MDKSKYQEEYDSLPEWAKSLIDGLKDCCGYGGGRSTMGEKYSTLMFEFKRESNTTKAFSGMCGAIDLKNALSAPNPPPTAEEIAESVIKMNVVELCDDGEDSAFDQPCTFGHRVNGHAVYCHNTLWPDSPRKCKRGNYWGEDWPHKDCPGYVANPDHVD